MPSAVPEQTMQMERQETLREIHDEQVDLAREVRTLHNLCVIIQGTNDVDVHLLPQVEAALTTFGVSAEEALVDKELLQMLKGEISALSDKRRDAETRDEAQLISSRMLELKDQMNLQSLVAQIRLEFGEQIDPETNGVIENYEALFDPQFITDEGERKVVESLFWRQGKMDFSEEQFSGFIETIQKQPDTLISEATKEKIRERFSRKGKPQNGSLLIKAIAQKDRTGKPVHNSLETAVKLDSGIMAYTNEQGETMFVYPDSGDATHYSTHPAPALKSGENYSDHINTNIVRTLIAEEYNNLQGLLGGTTKEGVLQNHYEADTLNNTRRFITCLLGSHGSDDILNRNQKSTISTYLKAFSNPLNGNKGEDLQDMTELGIYQNGKINWKQMNLAGMILRENKGFKLQGMQDAVAPYRLLKQELQQREH